MFSKIKILFLLSFLVLSYQSNATHIVGGELNYKKLTGNNYEIRLTVYRDCYVGVPPFDNPASLGVFDINNNLINSYNLTFLGLDTLPAEINDPCTIPPTDFCYEVTTYIDTINLPPIPGGYQLVYQRCCRNINILNIFDPSNTGATYYATIPDNSVVTYNSNPVFKNWPPPFICLNKPFVFDHSAIDYDGDSLVYELFTPFEGADPTTPMPQPPNNPPYATVQFITPYSTSNMLGGVPFSINSQTGLVTATPNTLGYFVIGVRCKEYRNGVFISETKRDFQLIVKDCPKLIVASATVPNVICASNTVSFTNLSIGAGTYSWNFGDLTTLADTSTQYSPSYTYPGTGSYNVSMIAYAPGVPACNDTVNTTVSISNQFQGTINVSQELCKPDVFKISGSVVSPPGTTATWNWTITDGFTTSDSSFTHTFANNGNYTITLITYIPGSLGCYDTLSNYPVKVIKEGNVFIPNTFTPNGDGKNDVLKVRGPSYQEFYFAIYNRFGEMVFETTDVLQGWDGTFKGNASDPGVYGYYLKAKCPGDSEQTFKKGNVTLIR